MSQVSGLLLVTCRFGLSHTQEALPLTSTTLPAEGAAVPCGHPWLHLGINDHKITLSAGQKELMHHIVHHNYEPTGPHLPLLSGSEIYRAEY